MDEKKQKETKIGYIYLTIFAVLIAGGIIHKRMFNHPEFMMLWHLPAAIFLMLGGRSLTASNRRRYFKQKNS